jgi:putative hydrolase of HD superfamily
MGDRVELLAGLDWFMAGIWPHAYVSRFAHKNDMKNNASFLYEVGHLSRTPRSGLWFLGSGRQSVAEHSHRVAIIGWLLARETRDADILTTLQMCLLHDLAETRTGDLNYVHQRYASSDERLALDDIAGAFTQGDALKEILHAYARRGCLEAKLTKDADTLEWVLTLREQTALGNPKAARWIEQAGARLNTDQAKQLYASILETDPDAWYERPGDPWWVSPNKNRDGRL